MPKKILIVDDSTTVRHQLAAVLRDATYQVIEAAGAHEALVQAGDQQLDLVIADVNMPGMDGFELVRRLRQLAHHARTPVFMLTTESSIESVRRGKDAGVTAWMVKPYKPDILLKGVAKVTGG